MTAPLHMTRALTHRWCLVRAEVPLSAEARVVNSPGYTHDAFFDEVRNDVAHKDRVP